MATWTAKLIADLDAADERAHALAGGLATEQLNWQAGPTSWSIGQCLDHLCVTNDAYLPPMIAALEGKPKGAASEIRPGWFGGLFLKKVIEPSPATKQFKAPTKIVPASRVDGTVLERFLRGNQELRNLIERAKDYDVNRIRFKNPFIGMIRFTVGTGLTIVVRHQHRHLLQAERVKEATGFPQ
jgi:DinB family protein